jgi:MYXO-CTERM domain-containing protein
VSFNLKSLGATAVALLALTAGTAQALDTTTVDFGSGTGGWSGPSGIGGATFIDPTMGNSAPALRTQFNNFGIAFTNSTAAFTGDWTVAPSVTFSVDVFTTSVQYFGMDVTRELVLELRDYDSAINGMPYTSVWFSLGTLSGGGSGWQHLSVTISDTGAAALPAGWGGYGDEDNFGSPILPAGVTFADVLRGVDQVALTTLVPGYFYGFTDFDVAIDNVSVTAVPEPTSAALLGLGVLGLAAARRMRRRD